MPKDVLVIDCLPSDLIKYIGSLGFVFETAGTFQRSIVTRVET